MDKLKTVQANSSLPLPQPTLSVAGFRSDNGMCFNQFALFTIFESIIYRVYGMICHLPIGDRSLTSLNLLLTNFRVNRSKTEMVSQKTVYRFQNSWGRNRLPLIPYQIGTIQQNPSQIQSKSLVP